MHVQFTSCVCGKIEIVVFSVISMASFVANFQVKNGKGHLYLLVWSKQLKSIVSRSQQNFEERNIDYEFGEKCNIVLWHDFTSILSYDDIFEKTESQTKRLHLPCKNTDIRTFLETYTFTKLFAQYRRYRSIRQMSRLFWGCKIFHHNWGLDHIFIDTETR